MGLFTDILNIFNWGSGPGDDRWHPPMTTDISKLGEYGSEEAAFGDKDGDHPRPHPTVIIGGADDPDSLYCFDVEINDAHNIKIRE